MSQEISISKVRVDANLVPYLELTGWELTETPNDRWYIFHESHNNHEALHNHNEPLEIVLPKIPTAHDLNIYINNALELLSALSNETVQEMIRRIVFFQSDILYSRDLETGDYNSISLKLASQQILELKNIIYFGACSEREPKPYFLSAHYSIAKKMTEQYRFGHTFEGSFGFTIESPIINLLSYTQLSIFEDEPLPPPVPFERRIMERIARGLIITEMSAQSSDVSPLISEYFNGFNSNMCNSLVKMSQRKKEPMEYSFIWSPKFPLSEDLIGIKPVRLDERSYTYLEYAADELKRLEPIEVKVIGKVVGLTAKDNPLGLETSRSVIVKGRYEENSRPVYIEIDLEKDDYLIAHKAHIGWNQIEVNGLISRSGNSWRLSNPKNFRILN